MKLWMILAGAGLLIVCGGGLALVLLGIWPGPSTADRERAGALLGAAQAHLESGDQDAALNSLSEAIHLAPQNAALRMRASIHMARGQFDDALRDYDRIIGRDGALAADFSTSCWLRARGEALERARRDCERAIAMNPALAAAFGNRGIVGLRQNRNVEAWNDFNEALRVGGSDAWVSWRLFGRGLAAIGQGRSGVGREDIEQAMRANPAVAAEFAQFGLGAEVVREFDDAAYASAVDPRSLEGLRLYLSLYPNGAHVAEAQTQIEEINAWIAEDQAAGQRALPGFSLSQARGPGAPDSFGAIAISRSSWRVAFSTDYADPVEAMGAAAAACNASAVSDCDAYAFRNVCAALALSPRERARGMAWAYGRDDAVRGAVADCRAHGGQACAAVHSQCTPTPPTETPTQ